MNGYLDKFLTWISLNLPKEALNALRIIQFIIGTNFWNTLYTAFLMYFKTSKKYLEMSQIYLTFMGLNNSHFTSATRNLIFLAENFLTKKKKKETHYRHALKWRQCYKRELSLKWSASMQIIGTKGGVCLRKELDSHRICLGHQQNSLYSFPGYCSCSDTRNIWLFF